MTSSATPSHGAELNLPAVEIERLISLITHTVLLQKPLLEAALNETLQELFSNQLSVLQGYGVLTSDETAQLLKAATEESTTDDAPPPFLRPSARRRSRRRSYARLRLVWRTRGHPRRRLSGPNAPVDQTAPSRTRAPHRG